MTKARDLANVEAKATLTDTQTLTNKTLTSPVLGGTTTTASGNLAVLPATYILEVQGGASTEGAIQLNCAVNSHGQKVKSQPHAQAASNTLLLPGGTTIGNSDAVLVSNTGTQTLTNKTLTSAVLTGTLTAGGSVGTNGQVLTSTGTGVQYATPSSGSMTLLSTTTLSGATTTISISDQTYNNLYAIISGVTNATSNGTFRVAPNNSTTLVSVQEIIGNNIYARTDGYLVLTANVEVLGSGNNENVFTFTINDYASTSKYKTVNTLVGYNDTGNNHRGGGSLGYIRTTSAITSLVFSNNGGNFSTGTVLLYGVK